MAVTQRQQRYLDEVRRIVLAHLDGYDAGVWLIGSFARGDPRRASDIDVAIEPHENVPPGLFFRIAEDLDASTVPYFVELVDLSETDAEFREAAKHQGVAWRR